MRFWASLLVFIGVFMAGIGAAGAAVRIHVDLSAQRMHVESATGSYDWPVSTARSGYSTPRGSFAPTGLKRMHYSRKYHMSPMPYSIFFRGGYAIHGTNATSALGKPASHGCVRLAPGHAAELFAMVKAEGASIEITGTPPQTRYASAHRRHAPTRYAALRHRHSSALAYAPTGRRHVTPVRFWQAQPLRSPFLF